MDTMLRRRAMIAAGVSPTPPTPPTPSTPDYELSSPTTTQEYNTGVKLFDSAKSFTILCEATYNNYNWSAYTQGLFGVLSGAKNLNFKLGSIDNGNDYRSGVLLESANRFTAIVMNKTASNRRCSSVVPKTNGDRTDRFFVRYNASTRLVESGNEALPTTRYYTVDGVYSSSAELKLLIGGASGTISIFKVYLSLLSDAEINAFFE